MGLRLRLALLVLALTTALLGGLGLYLGGALQGWATEAADGELEHRALVLARAVKFEHGGLEVEGEELGEGTWPFRLETEAGERLAGSGLEWPGGALPERGFATVERRPGERWRVLSRAFLPEHGEGQILVLRVAAPLTAFTKVAERFRVGLTVALLLAALLGAAGATLVAQLFLAPLRRLSGEVDGIEARSLGTRLSTRGLDPELSRLASAFNGLLGRVAQAFDAQRAFVGRASHALRTPLASILSQAEVALRRERTAAEYQQALGAIADAARDSARLADGLMALNRAEGGSGAPAREQVSLQDLAGELQRLFGPRAEVAGLGFTAGAPADLVVTASRDRLRELLDALVDNALRYTPRGGSVRFDARAEGDRVVLEVSDTGLGVGADERAQIFERFFRGSAAQKSGQQGSGLGLAVVKALAEAEGASVQLDDAPGGGTRAQLRFPRA